ncbi:MAG: hypothetical protein KJO77_09645 [Bacteroidia bacterium]|nr:hypothetical protein [Bacteroidia bacterium]
MKIKALLLFIGCFLITSLYAQEEILQEKAAVLFKDSKSNISNAEKNEIFELTGFDLLADKSQFHLAENKNGEFPFKAYVYPLDLNNDGIEEIGITFGNMITSGNVGSSAFLFIKNEKGHYVRHFGIPGFLAFLPLENNDFPDVIIGGTNLEFPVWRWNGTEFSMDRKISQTEFNKVNAKFMNEVSKAYTHSLSKE